MRVSSCAVLHHSGPCSMRCPMRVCLLRAIVWTLAAVASVSWGAASAAAQSPEPVHYYHTDEIGSVRMVTDHTGQVVSQHNYQPFGEEWQAPAGSDERVRFAGKELDPETGSGGWMPLNYFGARYLHSASGRFTSVDPGHVGGYILEPQSWNGYAYAGNNPLRFVDPTGTDYRINAYGGTPFVFEGSYSAFREYVTGQGFSLKGNMFHGGIVSGSGTEVGTYDEWTQIDQLALGISQAGPMIEFAGKEMVKNAVIVTGTFGVGLAAKVSIEVMLASRSAIVFKTGHYASRLFAAGVNVDRAETAVQGVIRNGGPFHGTITVDGVLLEYRAMRLADGRINVGTIFPQR
jgi:RHS repeat-associated protein